MPARVPPAAPAAIAPLAALGSRLRAQRKQHGLSAVTAAEAAGLSRMTLHRIERGEPSVAMGAYMNVVAALGLALALTGTDEHRGDEPAPARAAPQSIRVGDYPQLRRLAWQMNQNAQLTPAEALSLYERNWRHVEPAALRPHERALIESLAAAAGGGRLLV